MTEPSISFDRAAAYYDETRVSDPGHLRVTIDLLDATMPGQGPVLEVGVGTGQLAIPLAARGIPVIGVDLSADMMAVLRSKTRGSAVRLVRADATRLPIADASLVGAYARWVLHLIPEWMQVLRELDRTVVAVGAVAIEPGGFSGPLREVYLRYHEILGDAVAMVGLSALDRAERLDEGFGEVGWSLRDVVRVRYEHVFTLREVLVAIPTKRSSWTWRVPDADLQRATDEVRAWAEERFGGLDGPGSGGENVWRVYRRAA